MTVYYSVKSYAPGVRDDLCPKFEVRMQVCPLFGQQWNTCTHTLTLYLHDTYIQCIPTCMSYINTYICIYIHRSKHKHG